MVLPELLKSKRQQKKLTQRQLAFKIGTSYQHVQQWEKGIKSPSADYLIKLIEILDITTNELKEANN